MISIKIVTEAKNEFCKYG